MHATPHLYVSCEPFGGRGPPNRTLIFPICKVAVTAWSDLRDLI